MKKPLLILFLFLYFFSLFLAALTPLKLTTDKNTFHAGDSLYKYQVMYKNPGSIGRELEWDFIWLNVVDENYLIRYFHPDKKDTTSICGMEHRTRYYYRQRNDSLWSTGFENYTTLMNYTVPELKLKFPFSYGDTLYSEFEGEGLYCNLLPLKVKGWTRVKADAEGKLKLPDGITIPDALRTHTLRYYTETGKDSLQMTLDTYTWYAKNLRYPVFESIKTTLHKQIKKSNSPSPQEEGVQRADEVKPAGSEVDTTVFYTSFYYSPEELQIKNTTDSTDTYGNPIPEAERVFTEARMLPNPVISNLIIDFKLTRRAQIWFSVHNNIGIPMRQTTPQILDEGYHQITIPMGGLVTGTYTVYVHVDDMVIQRVVVKK